MRGKVYLVGAGPGDPRLITLRGMQCSEMADVLVYDRLVHRDIVSRASAKTELIYVGKESSHHTMKQTEINELLIERARQGKIVTRLKGGDPFVFGRGGEEAEALFQAGIPFEIVPGVTSAIAVPAYAGIPLTHRGVATSFAVVTGHEDPAKLKSAVKWASLAIGVDTLVFLMGFSNLDSIVENLIQHGRSPATPSALIRRGTLPKQRMLISALGDLPKRAVEEDFGPPSVLVVGNVVNLRDSLRWFDNRPLSGLRVLVTRAREQASALSGLLFEHGAEPIELPAISIRPSGDYEPLNKAIDHLDSYDWLIFTSVNGVTCFFEHLLSLGRDSRELKGLQVAAIGQETSRALGQHGIRADFVPQEYVAEEIVAGLAANGVNGKRVLLPRAADARDTLPKGLTEFGAKVDEVVVYRTVIPEHQEAEAKTMLREGRIDVVTFTSSSTVRNLVKMLEGDLRPLKETTVACIGPITAKTAEDLGITVDIVAQEYTITGLVDALVVKARYGQLVRPKTTTQMNSEGD